MPIAQWFSNAGPFDKFKTSEALFRGLERQDRQAILCLQLQSRPTIRKLIRNAGAPPDILDDVLNRSTLVFLQKIEQGGYEFKGFAPSTYFIEIAKRMILMALRSKNTAVEPLDTLTNVPDSDMEALRESEDSAELLRQFLDKLGSPCRELVRLHHIDGYSDEEVIRMGLTAYKTTDSLKMMRSNCMKKLIQIAREWKISKNI